MPEQRFKLKIEDLKKGSDSLKDNLELLLNGCRIMVYPEYFTVW